MKLLRQIKRGCTTLPHVGGHPGGVVVSILVLMGAAAGEKGGWRGILIGAVVMGIVFVPMYLYGAYSRANLSDQMEAERTKGGAQ